MNNSNFDILIIGSGAAGVSAAFPLLAAGLRVAMVDGGRTPRQPPPQQEFLQARANDPQQWRWMVGSDFHALRLREAVSPKLRAPPLAFAFEGFAAANRVAAQDFIAVGSMAAGGLTNAWGCGVARFTQEEGRFPFAVSELDASYEAVARRMGISGGADDDLSAYFGLDDIAAAPLPMDSANQLLLRRYQSARPRLNADGFRLGRPRVAVIGADRDGRRACDLSGNCLFGCHRGAMYSASQDLERLRRQPNFTWMPGTVVHGFERADSGWAVHALGEDGKLVTLTVPKLVVAAGTIATSALVLRALRSTQSLRLLSAPTAAFLLWLPARLGQARERGFGLGQLAFTLDLDGGGKGFGSTFATTGLPMWEFARHLPLGRRSGMKLLRHLLGSCLVGNLFLPGDLSDAQVSLAADGQLRVDGRQPPEADRVLARARSDLARAWWRLGAWMLPGSFTAGRPGSDIHYAGTLPMTPEPVAGQTSTAGEVHGLPGVFVVDGACLPALPEKSHTLTLMANADRIGRLIARSRQ
ncbi:MAG: 4Fe-4S ferredoxin [Rhodoferax sp.]|nr:4Fe-4S ferredoxin [Rhodoferax sp.]